jgi:SAM-dependent methyltransferase
MPQGWQWDATLFEGSAAYYARGRLPYPAALAPTLAAALHLDGHGRLLDVGCGPGVITLRLAHLFAQAVGLDPDDAMLGEAARRAHDLAVANVRWVRARAEQLPLDLGTFRAATFAASFHWMERDLVAATIRDMLEPRGAFVQISAETDRLPEPIAIKALTQRYLGPERHAGQGVLRHGTPNDELDVLRRAGFGEPDVIAVRGGGTVIRSVDEVVAAVFSHSASAPHLFAEHVGDFESELRALLTAAQPPGGFVDRIPDAELRIWRRSTDREGD